MDRTAAKAFLGERRSRWTRADSAIAAAIALAMAVRWPDRARYFLTWDAHTFALALERYDVNALRPHAPGYPVYVALGRLANALLADPNDALIALGITATAAGIVLAYAVGSRLMPRGLALAACLLLLCAPLLHIHAMTANSYAAEVAFATLVAWAAWTCRQAPTARNAVVLAAAFAVAVGVRQSMAFLLGPLVAWAALRPPWDAREQARRLGPAVATGAAIGLAWFVPMAIASGGLATWRRANELQGQVVLERPVWQDPGMLAVNLERMHLYLRWEATVLVPVLLGLALAVAGVLLARRHRPMWPSPTPHGRAVAAFLAAWAGPGWLFYLAVYSGYGNGPSGYTLLLLPPMYLAATWMAWRLLRALPWPRPATLTAAGLALVLAGAGLASHAHDAADIDYRVNDAWAENWSHLGESFPASNSTIVTAYNFAHLWFYYREHQVFEYRPPGKAVGEVPDFLLIQEARHGEATPDWYDAIADGGRGGPHPLANGTKHLVLFDFQLAGENGGTRLVRPEHPVREAFLPNGWRVLVVDTVPGQETLEDYFLLRGGER